mmetsp:Transcript_17624/g.35812  ORF Transcript_17624/g.35812 Transcript_17624/m.35812 type:complete len:210 (-) Transcript_17624:140-769(-)
MLSPPVAPPPVPSRCEPNEVEDTSNQPFLLDSFDSVKDNLSYSPEPLVAIQSFYGALLLVVREGEDGGEDGEEELLLGVALRHEILQQDVLEVLGVDISLPSSHGLQPLALGPGVGELALEVVYPLHGLGLGRCHVPQGRREAGNLLPGHSELVLLGHGEEQGLGRGCVHPRSILVALAFDVRALPPGLGVQRGGSRGQFRPEPLHLRP